MKQEPAALLRGAPRCPGICRLVQNLIFLTKCDHSAQLLAEMGKSFKILRFSFLVAALLPLSCVTRLPPPNGFASLNGRSAIVFGKIDVTVDNALADPEPPIFRPVVQCVISPYISKDKVRGNPFRIGKYSFTVPINDNSYFSFVIPPGRYYFVEFRYIWLFSAFPTSASERARCITRFA